MPKREESEMDYELGQTKLSFQDELLYVKFPIFTNLIENK